VTLRRGFKAEAERLAASVREDLGLSPHDELSLDAAAEHLGIRLVSAETLVDLDRLNELERLQAFSFSACTFDIDGVSVIVYNPIRSEARRRSDIAHEISHIILDHQLSELREIAGVPFRSCRPDQEEEATNLGGTLLLPRPMLIKAATRGMSIEQVAKDYRVTTDMARFRLNTTGVTRQVARARAPRPS
jgi:Zn-dependent peptidase ImmA (M78 family)